MGKRKYERPPRFTCEFCGTTNECRKNYVRQRNKGFLTNQRFCSKSCANRGRASRVGLIDKNGYRYFTIDGRQVYEHRMVMAKIIGRELTSEETVHHRDGTRSNNESINLELWSSRHGKGQRIEDKIAFAKSLLEDYGYAVTQTDSAIDLLLQRAKDAA